MTKKAVAYCRFSTDLQKETSIEDQAALCEQIATREGFSLVKVYSDRAKTSATMFDRDGLLDLMKAARRKEFDAVITESPDRISRDTEDLAGVFKRLKFAEINIYDLKGEVTDLDIGIRGIMGPIWMKDLAAKVRRGINGRVRRGLVPGTLTYGYQLVPGKKGEREINPAEAAIVRRIFEEFAEGKPPREIARGLTRDGIATPRGNTAWNHNTLSGRSKGRGGMLGCRLYVGKLVWNVNTSILNPHTGRKIQRRNKTDDVIEQDVPHLRIVGDDLWSQAHAVQARRARPHLAGRSAVRYKSEQEHLLAGMLICEKCHGGMIVMQTTAADARVACAAAHLRSDCEHRRSYSLRGLETIVIDGMKAKLTNTKALVEYTKAYHARWAERQNEARTERETVRRALNRVTVQIDRYVAAIGETDEPVKAFVDKIKVLEVERAGLDARLQLIEAETGGADNVVSLHPAALDRFRINVEAIHTALSGSLAGEAAAPFRAAFRNVFERIIVHETRKKQPYAVTPYARLSAILGIELFPKPRTTEEMLSEQGVNANLIDADQDFLSAHNQTMGIIPLGRWQQAA